MVFRALWGREKQGREEDRRRRRPAAVGSRVSPSGAAGAAGECGHQGSALGQLSPPGEHRQSPLFPSKAAWFGRWEVIWVRPSQQMLLASLAKLVFVEGAKTQPGSPVLPWYLWVCAPSFSLHFFSWH